MNSFLLLRQHGLCVCVFPCGGAQLAHLMPIFGTVSPLSSSLSTIPFTGWSTSSLTWAKEEVEPGPTVLVKNNPLRKLPPSFAALTCTLLTLNQGNKCPNLTLRLDWSKRAMCNNISCFLLTLKYDCVDFDLTLAYYTGSDNLDNSLNVPP